MDFTLDNVGTLRNPDTPFDGMADFVYGDLGLTDAEEDAIVAFMKTLSDRTP